ncbi:hypothetical protein [Salibacterium aidingense]|uniref:hypothetical protein n=1 Tax=Salibacterium aidingense TaxID=384933 RepID=UPI00040DE0D5|nr:hypothetical protein [Salibacterium aidingense]
MKRLAVLLAALAVFILPSSAYASSVNAWNDAEPAFVTGLTVISIIAILLFIYLMIRDNG